MRLKIDIPQNTPENPVPEDRTELHGLLGRVLEQHLVGHFDSRQNEPNWLNAPKTGFWSQVAESTQYQGDADATGATVSISDERFPLHLFGGTVRPKNAKALTIPIDAKAHGKRASVLEAELGIELFSITSTKGKGLLVSADAEGNLSLWYLLAKSATIKKDAKALPPEAELMTALKDTMRTYFERRPLA